MPRTLAYNRGIAAILAGIFAGSGAAPSVAGWVLVVGVLVVGVLVRTRQPIGCIRAEIRCHTLCLPSRVRKGVDVDEAAQGSHPTDSRDSASWGPAQQPLPFADDVDEPVAFALTARAKRVVAPEDLPRLTIVARPSFPTRAHERSGRASAGTASAELDDPSDTRPSRARALRRAGLTPSAIATQLGVDRLLVQAWTGVTPQAASTSETSPPGSGPVCANPDDVSSESGAPDERTTALRLARASASDEAAQRLGPDAAFAAGLGLLGGIADIDEHAVTITTSERDVAARVLAWLDEHVPLDRTRVRVVLQLGSAVAGDLVAHRLAGELRVPGERVATTRWHEAPSPEAVRVLLRVADPIVAATVAGWRDALLAPSRWDPADMAF